MRGRIGLHLSGNSEVFARSHMVTAWQGEIGRVVGDLNDEGRILVELTRHCLLDISRFVDNKDTTFGAPGLATRNKKLLGAKGIATNGARTLLIGEVSKVLNYQRNPVVFAL